MSGPIDVVPMEDRLALRVAFYRNCVCQKDESDVRFGPACSSCALLTEEKPLARLVFVHGLVQRLLVEELGPQRPTVLIARPQGQAA